MEPGLSAALDGRAYQTTTVSQPRRRPTYRELMLSRWPTSHPIVPSRRAAAAGPSSSPRCRPLRWSPRPPGRPGSVRLEQRSHMTRQHAPSDRVAELAVGDDLTVLCDLYQDGACCVGGLSQPRGESAHPVPHGEVVTDGDGERFSHGVMIRVVRALHKLVLAAPHPEASSDQLAMRRRTRMNPPPRAMAATARTMPVMLAPVSGRRLSPVAAAAAAAWP